MLLRYIKTHFKREEVSFLESDDPHKDKHLKNHRCQYSKRRGFAYVMRTHHIARTIGTGSACG